MIQLRSALGGFALLSLAGMPAANAEEPVATHSTATVKAKARLHTAKPNSTVDAKTAAQAGLPGDPTSHGNGIPPRKGGGPVLPPIEKIPATTGK